MIPDTIIIDLYRKIKAGEIKRGKKNYVFALKGGGSHQVEATNEKEAWDILEARGKKSVFIDKHRNAIFSRVNIF